MDIFEEVKEAVLSATPGEDTRNYYRNQGMAIERERIIKLLENKIFEDKRLWSKEFANGAKWAIKETVELINGETK